jgi:hypothetical protein
VIVTLVELFGASAVIATGLIVNGGVEPIEYLSLWFRASNTNC